MLTLVPAGILQPDKCCPRSAVDEGNLVDEGRALQWSLPAPGDKHGSDEGAACAATMFFARSVCQADEGGGREGGSGIAPGGKALRQSLPAAAFGGGCCGGGELGSEEVPPCALMTSLRLTLRQADEGGGSALGRGSALQRSLPAPASGRCDSVERRRAVEPATMSFPLSI